MYMLFMQLGGTTSV